MPYRFLEDVATADVCFEARGKTVEELFVAAAEATTNVMVQDLGQLAQEERRDIQVESEQLDLLLFDFLQELIFYKDAELLLFSKYLVKIERENSSLQLHAEVYGEKLDPATHDLVVDVKAVTLHQFVVKETDEGWEARVILDI